MLVAVTLLMFCLAGQGTTFQNLLTPPAPQEWQLRNTVKAAVVAEAYDFTPDWSEVLYQQVILKGDFNYLEEHKQQGLLRTATFEEIAHKFKQHPANESAVRNLKKLLTYCEDIYVYYKLAYDNQFYDVVNMLLNDAQTGCCLNDLLAN